MGIFSLVRDVSNDHDGKEQSSNCVYEGREVCIIDPALQVTQPETKESIKDILHRLLNNTSLKIPVRIFFFFFFTSKRIFVVTINFDDKFWETVVATVYKFYCQQVVPSFPMEASHSGNFHTKQFSHKTVTPKSRR